MKRVVIENTLLNIIDKDYSKLKQLEELSLNAFEPFEGNDDYKRLIDEFHSIRADYNDFVAELLYKYNQSGTNIFVFNFHQ